MSEQEIPFWGGLSHWRQYNSDCRAFATLLGLLSRQSEDARRAFVLILTESAAACLNIEDLPLAGIFQPNCERLTDCGSLTHKHKIESSGCRRLPLSVCWADGRALYCGISARFRRSVTVPHQLPKKSQCSYYPRRLPSRTMWTTMTLRHIVSWPVRIIRRRRGNAIPTV